MLRLPEISGRFSLRSLALASALALWLTVLPLFGASLLRLSSLSDVDHAYIVAEGMMDSQLPTQASSGFWFGVPSHTGATAIWVEHPGPDLSFYVLCSYVRAIRLCLAASGPPLWDSYVDPDMNDPTFLWAGGIGVHPEIAVAIVLSLGVVVLIWAGGWRVAVVLLKVLVRRLTRRL